MFNRFDYSNLPREREPHVGQKIQILDWEMFSSNEAVKLAKLPYLTVSEYFPMLMQNDNGDYFIDFQCHFEESSAMVPPEQYKLIW